MSADVITDIRPRSATGQSAPVADVDVVIVAYHSRDYVLAALDSIPAAAAGLAVTCTVVDNDSGDGLVAAVRARSDGARAIQMGRNAGFSVANNRGMAAGSGRYALILNPDTVLRPGALRTLVEFADAHPDAGVVAPRLLYADGSRQLTARRFPTPAAAVFGRRSPLTRWLPGNPWSRAFLLERERPQSDDRPFEADWVSGAAMLVRRDVVNETGGFDESFFLFWEDADWCFRIRRAGHAVWCVPTAVVVHDEGGTRDHGWQPATIRSFHAGAYRYWSKHHAPQAWNPLRWAAAGLLAGRAGALIALTQLRRPATSTALSTGTTAEGTNR